MVDDDNEDIFAKIQTNNQQKRVESEKNEVTYYLHYPEELKKVDHLV